MAKKVKIKVDEICATCGLPIVKANTGADIYSVCETCPECLEQMHSYIVCPNCGFDTSYP